MCFGQNWKKIPLWMVALSGEALMGLISCQLPWLHEVWIIKSLIAPFSVNATPLMDFSFITTSLVSALCHIVPYTRCLPFHCRMVSSYTFSPMGHCRIVLPFHCRMFSSYTTFGSMRHCRIVSSYTSSDSSFCLPFIIWWNSLDYVVTLSHYYVISEEIR
jgi:hypothetical protein